MAQRGGFTIPFVIGTLVGVISGTLVGVFLARRVVLLIQRIIGRITGTEPENQPRLDLLLQ